MDRLTHKNLQENLKEKIGNVAWESATSVAGHLVDLKRIDLAKKHLKKVIENGESDGKDIKVKLNGWLEGLKKTEKDEEKLDIIIELLRWLKAEGGEE
ncbi:MAG: hypothetical protein WC847_00575 [Candidatus Paceibacterota bacterium]|jgi:hypothetical protein